MKEGVAPLVAAASGGHLEVVKVNQATTDTGATALYLAAQKGHLEMVKVLLAAKCGREQTNDRKWLISSFCR